MRIRQLFFVQAALLPAAALATLVLVGGLLLRSALLDTVDEGLESLAAVETISLFDSAPVPHLHLAGSPLAPQVQAFAPSRAVYDADGRQVAVEETVAAMPGALDEAGPLGRITLRTVGGARELKVGVSAPDGARYTLLLRSSLAPLEGTVSTYYRVLGLGAALVSLGFILVQARLSDWWANRIGNMIRHTRRLEAGDLRSRPDPDPNDDEIGELVVAVGRASARLEEARRAQDRLVADAAHELRTPLAAIRAEIDVTLRRPRSPESLREALEEVRAEVDRLSLLSTRLLDLARLAADSWHFEPGDLADVVGEVVEAHQGRAEAKQVRLRYARPPHLSTRFDEGAIRQAVSNLVDNAIKFSPHGGEVEVHLGESRGRWRLEVKDAGPGVPPEERGAIFEPFRRLDTRAEGAGLGLAIVRDVARGHRGEIHLVSADRGARFVLEAPLREN